MIPALTLVSFALLQSNTMKSFTAGKHSFTKLRLESGEKCEMKPRGYYEMRFPSSLIRYFDCGWPSGDKIDEQFLSDTWWIIGIMKVKSDHRSKFSNLSNWKEEAWKISGLQWDSNCEDHSSLSSTTAVQIWISYKFHIGIIPCFSFIEAASMQINLN